MKKIHPVQQKILEASNDYNLGQLTLREIGELVGVPHPQKVKHHLTQLGKDGLIKIDKKRKLIQKISEKILTSENLISLPILGRANCGEATIFSDEYVEGYLKISTKLLEPQILSHKNNLFIIKASGNSMNRSDIAHNNIEDGDYILIDSVYQKPTNGDYILSVIDGMANIKKIIKDEKNRQIILLSESTQEYPPIYIHEDDLDSYLINGKVVQVIKKPKI